MAYHIESDVEPPEFIGRAWKTIYPWAQMHEGDSILIGRAKVESARRSASGFAVRHPGWKFTARSEGEALRIWCIERAVSPITKLPLRHSVSISQLPVRLVKRMGD